MKKYKAIFFDWDGTAVTSRKAPVDEVVKPMKQLLKNGVKLAIISGTTIENIANGRLPEYFEADELKNLYLGLGRGAYNYTYDDNKKPYLFSHRIPGREGMVKLHEICFEIHKVLLEQYGFLTDVVFSRPNYCKIDLMVENNRGEQLFLQESELTALKESLEAHGFKGGLMGLIELAQEIGNKNGFPVIATTDAKYLEVGITSKSDNVDTILAHFSKEYEIEPKDCSYWGDEYLELDTGIYGSDSYMITGMTMDGDFYDVSESNGNRTAKVRRMGGGVEAFLKFLKEQPV